MFSRILCLCFLLSLGIETAHAHQPDVSSTVLAESGDNQWVLQVRAALTAFEYEIHHHFGADSYKTPEAFQELTLNYVKDNISILFDGANVAKLKNGVVKLGHETNVVFEVEGIPQNFSNVEFKNSSFKDISRNQSALIILKKGFSKEQFILNNKNRHTVSLAVQDSKFIAVSNSNTTTAMTDIYLLLGVLVFTGVVAFLYGRNKN